MGNGLPQHHKYFMYSLSELVCSSLVQESKKSAKQWYYRVSQKNKTLFFSPNFQTQSIGKGLSDLLKNQCAKSPHCGLFAQEISSDSDKWSPSYCSWKLGDKKSDLFFLGHPVVLTEQLQKILREQLQKIAGDYFIDTQYQNKSGQKDSCTEGPYRISDQYWSIEIGHNINIGHNI